MKDGEQWF